MSQVLLADDDRELCNVLQTLLVDAGHDVMTACNGLEEIAAALAVVPQVIVTDVRMPVLEGPAAVGILRSIHGFPHVPVVFMSGEAREATIGSGERFLRKPFDPGLLLNTVACLAPTSREEKDPEDPAGGAGARPCTAAARQRHCIGSERGKDPVARALTLISEQDRRLTRLKSLGADVALAAELRQSLINSLVALAGFERCVEPLTVSGRH